MYIIKGEFDLQIYRFTDFTISVDGSSCNFLFSDLVFSLVVLGIPSSLEDANK